MRKIVGELERRAQRPLVDLLCMLAIVLPTLVVVPADAAPAPSSPDQSVVVAPKPDRVRSAVAELKAACVAWFPVYQTGAGKIQQSPPAVPGFDGEVCSFARDPEGKLWTYRGYGALVAALVLIIASMVLGFACAALGMGWRAFHRAVWEWRGIQGRG
jgi:hypothetical protein